MTMGTFTPSERDKAILEDLKLEFFPFTLGSCS